MNDCAGARELIHRRELSDWSNFNHIEWPIGYSRCSHSISIVGKILNLAGITLWITYLLVARFCKQSLKLRLDVTLDFVRVARLALFMDIRE